MKRVIIAISIIAIARIGYGQKKITSLIDESQASSSKEFFYKTEWLDSITVEQSEASSWQELEKILGRSGFNIYHYQERYVFIYPNKLEFERIKQGTDSRKVEVSSKFLRVGNPVSSLPNTLYELSGTITDEQGQPVYGATVSIESTGKGDVTDENGVYEIMLYPGNYAINYSFLGHEPETRYITFYSSGAANLSLFQHTQLLDEVIVENEGTDALMSEKVIGKSKIDIEKLETIPAFLGEVDVVKGVTMLPGVNLAGESSSYLNVRGGRNDQTLILMNNGPIYTPGHLLGFISVFNGDFVSDISLYKGNIPARYGIRSSSVLDVRMGRWAEEKSVFYGGLGIVNSNIGYKTKLLEEKLDIHLGGRIAYPDWMFGLVRNKDILRSSARYADGNIMLRFVPDKRNTFHFSNYLSNDYFRYSEKIIYEWNVLNGSLEWDHLFGNGWVSSSQINYSSLNNFAEGIEINQGYEMKNGISSVGIRQEMSIPIGLNEIQPGVEINHIGINPGEIVPLGGSRIQSEDLDNENLQEIGVYVDSEFKLFEHLLISPGIRYSIFRNMGPGEVNIYTPGAPFTSENLQSQKLFQKGESIATYNRLEPRLGLSIILGNSRIKVGYTRTNQFLHLIANTALINPVSIWKGSDSYIAPTRIDQYSLGYMISINQFVLSTEGYFKEMQDVVDYRDGAELVLNPALEQDILSGKARAYGLEFSVTKDGNPTMEASYTYSRAFIRTAGISQSESINDGKEYPYYSDRPHNIKFNSEYEITKKWTVAANFIFSSGAPTSAPSNVFQIDDINIPYFPERNTARIPDYHRLDISITLKSRIRKTKKNNDRWVLSVYNVYARKNASTVFFARNDGLPAQPFQLVSIGNIIPTLTYKFEF